MIWDTTSNASLSPQNQGISICILISRVQAATRAQSLQISGVVVNAIVQ